MSKTSATSRKKNSKCNSFFIVFVCFLFALIFFISSIFLTQKKYVKEIIIPVDNSLTPKTNTDPQHPSTKPRGKRFLDVTKETRALRIPVLLYPDIQDVPFSSSSEIITKKEFENQMLFLKNNGFTTITLDEFIAAYNGNLNLPKKSVLITFDNGYVSLKKYANPFLIKHNLNAVAFIVGQHMGDSEKYLNVKDVYNIQIDRKFDIESKSFSLFNVNTQQSITESTSFLNFINDNRKMEVLIGHKINAFSHPLSKFSDTSIRNIQSANIQFAFTTVNEETAWVELTSLWGDIQDPYSLPRIPIMSNISIQQFEKLVTDEQNHLLSSK